MPCEGRRTRRFERQFRAIRSGSDLPLDQSPPGFRRRSARDGCYPACLDRRRSLRILLSNREGRRGGVRQSGADGIRAADSARFAAIASGEQSGYAYRQWSDVLRAIYLAQRNMAAYVALAGQTGLTPQDRLALGTLIATCKPNEALAWVDRGIAIDREGHIRSTAAYDLDRLQRELLTSLGRGDQARE